MVGERELGRRRGERQPRDDHDCRDDTVAGGHQHDHHRHERENPGRKPMALAAPPRSRPYQTAAIAITSNPTTIRTRGNSRTMARRQDQRQGRQKQGHGRGRSSGIQRWRPPSDIAASSRFRSRASSAWRRPKTRSAVGTNLTPQSSELVRDASSDEGASAACPLSLLAGAALGPGARAPDRPRGVTGGSSSTRLARRRERGSATLGYQTDDARCSSTPCPTPSPANGGPSGKRAALPAGGKAVGRL